MGKQQNQPQNQPKNKLKKHGNAKDLLKINIFLNIRFLTLYEMESLVIICS